MKTYVGLKSCFHAVLISTMNGESAVTSVGTHWTGNWGGGGTQALNWKTWRRANLLASVTKM
jgi:hypothetical protein